MSTPGANRYKISELRAAFNDARARQLRYVAVIEQVQALKYRIIISESIIVTSDAMDIIRSVREKGLRPQAPRTKLRRVFDTREAAFIRQLAMSEARMYAVNLPQDAQDAYQRYLAVRAAMDKTDLPKVKTGKRWFGRD